MKSFPSILTAGLIALLFSPFMLSAQLKAVTIGDKVPDFSFGIANYPAKQAKLSDFKGKMVILDFWGTFCSTCILNFPKLEALQKEFGNKIQIILVNPHEQASKIAETIKKYKGYKPGIGLSTLPAVNGDERWKVVFPHSGVPYHVWIDKNGKVIATPAPGSATAQNIQKALDGKGIGLINQKVLQGYEDNLANKNYNAGFFKPAQPAFKPLQYSGFTRVYQYTNVNKVGIDKDTLAKTLRGIFSNQGILQLYEIAARNKYKPATITTPPILETKDPLITYSIPQDGNLRDDWTKKNIFSYEIFNASLSYNQLGDIMLKDLNNFFGNLYGIEGVVERRKLPALVLIRTDTGKTLTRNGIRSSETANGVRKWKNYPFAGIAYVLYAQLQDLTLPRLFVDESKYSGNADMELTSDLKDVENIRNQIRKYGFDLVQEEREANVLIVRNRN